MRFDWYQTTIEDNPIHVIETIKKLGHELRPADSLARKYRYSQGFAVHHHQDGVVAHVFAGGNGDKPHAYASAEATDAFVALVREEWPDRHLVTRMDAAEDFNESGAFDRLRPLLKRIAKRHQLSFPKIEDELNSKAGRTQYVGSTSSDYRARLYEKGWEQVNKLLALYKTAARPDPESIQLIRNTITGEDVKPEDWTRLELQVRPRQEEGRRQAAIASPDQAWGFTDWSHEVASKALALELERICIRTRKVSKDEEAIRWMCQHYGAMLARLKDDLGCWEGVGFEIGKIISEQRNLS
jgi:hypothetical protein